jgi:hypothetical protein
MESQHEPRPRSGSDTYEAPMGVELGKLADLTAGKGGSSSDGYGGCSYPSSR